MSCNQSVVIIVPAENLLAARAAINAWWGEPVGTENIVRAMTNTGNAPATHYVMHSPFSPGEATALKDWPSGVLPATQYDGISPVDWSAHGLTPTTALAAGQTMYVQVAAAPAGQYSEAVAANISSALAAFGLIDISWAPTP